MTKLNQQKHVRAGAWLAGAFAVALLAAANPATNLAPNPAPAAADQETPAPTTRQEAEREEAARREREQAARREREREEAQARERRAQEERAREKRETANGAQPTDPRLMQRAMIEQERRHRQRLGRIRSLAQVFRERGDMDKVAKLESLQAKENTRFERWMKAHEVKLGRARFNEISPMLERGRARGQANERGARERAQGREPERDDKEKERAREREREKEKKEKEKSRPPQKPEREKPGRPGGGRTDQPSH